MAFQILGIGTATPQHKITQTDAATMANSFCGKGDVLLRTLPALYRRSGVRTRYSVLLESSDGLAAAQSFYAPIASPDDQGPSTSARMEAYRVLAPTLALSSARAAISDAKVAPREITHLVTVSCSGFSAPGVDVELITQLGLPLNVARTHVGFMGCHGALNGLRVAKAMAESESQACVLICCVELCSLHYQYGSEPEAVVANALFADGAATIVGRTIWTDSAWQLKDSASSIVPSGAELMKWSISNHGFKMALSPQVPDLIYKHLRPWLAEWLAKHKLRIEEIGSWAIHPGGPRILQACAEAISLTNQQLAPSLNVLSEFGNMSSPTVLFILQRLRQHGASRPCVLLAFGPGLTMEGALLL